MTLPVPWWCARGAVEWQWTLAEIISAVIAAALTCHRLPVGLFQAVRASRLGHESTQTTHIYENHADPALKEQAIARTAPLIMLST